MESAQRFRTAWWSVVVVLASSGVLHAQQEPANPVTRSEVLLQRLPVALDAAGPYVSDQLFWRIGTMTYGNTLGIDIADLDGTLRAQLSLGEDQGVVVTGVSPESAAAKAGLASHDLVLKVDSQSVAGTKQFNDLVGSLQGKPVVFHLLRKGKPVEVAVALPQAPVYELTTSLGNRLWANALVAHAAADVDRKYRIGVSLSEADDVLRSQLRLASGEGLVVTEVLDDSPAGKAGIQKYDVLIKLDGKRLTTIEAINGQIQEIKDRKVAAVLLRAGNEISIDVTPHLTEEAMARWTRSQALRDWIDPRFMVTLRGDMPYTEAYNIVRLTQPQIAAGTTIAAPAPAEQITALKKQLADIQKSLEALETALQPAPTNPPVNQNTVPEEKK